MTKRRSEIRQVLAINFVAGLVSPFLQFWFGKEWTGRDLLITFVAGEIYANCIGTLAALTMMRGYPRLIVRPAWWRWSSITILLTLCAAVGCAVAGLILVAVQVMPAARFWSTFSWTFRFSLLLTFLLGFGSVIFETMRSRLEQTTLELRTKELERERALKLATEARLSSLESRIHPHFLFNALNSISALIREDPQRAERLIEQMAALLRFSLSSSQLGAVSLGDELKIVADYLHIEQARFGKRLRYTLDIPPELHAMEVPPLSIQTLVENSVKYAISPRREGGTVSVLARAEQGNLILDVSDDGPGFHIEEAPAGHGIDNLRARLQALYGDRTALEFWRLPDGMRVTIKLPAQERVAEAKRA